MVGIVFAAVKENVLLICCSLSIRYIKSNIKLVNLDV